MVAPKWTSGPYWPTEPPAEIERMEENDVPAAKINTREEVLTDPQVLNNNSIISTNKDGKEILRGPKPPANFTGTDCDEPTFSPALGQHSSEILKEYGYSDEEINSLIDNEIVQGGKIG